MIWPLPAAHPSSPALLSRVHLTQPHTSSLPGLKDLMVPFPGTPPSSLTSAGHQASHSGHRQWSPIREDFLACTRPSPQRGNSLPVCLLHHRTSHYAVSFSSNFSPSETIFSCSVFFYFYLLVCLPPTYEDVSSSRIGSCLWFSLLCCYCL